MNKQYPITVCGKQFLCEDVFGFEYLEKNVPKPWLPFQPYGFERLIDDQSGWLVDAMGIIWILYDGVWERPCCKEAVMYIYHRDQFMRKNLCDRLIEEFDVLIPPIRKRDYEQAMRFYQ